MPKSPSRGIDAQIVSNSNEAPLRGSLEIGKTADPAVTSSGKNVQRTATQRKEESMDRGTLLRISGVLTVGLMAAWPALNAQAGVARGSYHQTNLVSDIPGLALHTDSKLVNPWGLSSSSTSPIWVSDNNAGVSTAYRGDGSALVLSGQQVAPEIPAPGNVPGGTPTGTVFNPTNDFQITKGGSTGKAFFIFSTEDGTIAAWKPDSDLQHAVLVADNSAARDRAGDVGAVYKGLAFASTSAGNFLYATNFRFGTVDVFDGGFHQVQMAGAFDDPSIPSGFAPFGIQNLAGDLYVTYAKQDADKHDDVNGRGNGVVDVFSPAGVLLRRFASGGTLNSPWGLALAPPTFGNFHDDLLVGNFGDGRVNAFTQAGVFRGQLKSETNAPIQIDGLWGLRFGNGGAGGDPGTLFFAAGLNDETHGLFGSIANVD
jgi:uncharacterized protein (TIGR03118 family)